MGRLRYAHAQRVFRDKNVINVYGFERSKSEKITRLKLILEFDTQDLEHHGRDVGDYFRQIWVQLQDGLSVRNEDLGALLLDILDSVLVRHVKDLTRKGTFLCHE